MIEIVSTVESIDQAKKLLEADVDCLYFGEDTFGLRLPYSFSRKEQQEITELAHAFGKKVSVAVNAIFHNRTIELVREYLTFLKSIHVDSITVGDPGVVQIMKDAKYHIPYRYDTQVVVTSSRQIDFWAKRGAISAIVAREVPKISLEKVASKVSVPLEVLVYGATCIHQSKRPLLQNYFNYIMEQENRTEPIGKEKNYFLSEPQKPETHYSLYEDVNGTHIFATNDICLVEHLQELKDMNVTQWKLDGLFTHGDDFVAIAKEFAMLRDLVSCGKAEATILEKSKRHIENYHPKYRGMDTGFYLLDPSVVK